MTGCDEVHGIVFETMEYVASHTEVVKMRSMASALEQLAGDEFL